MYEHLLVSRPAEGIVRITLNRPRQLNALSQTTFRELQTSLGEFEKSDEAVLLLTGSGRAFSFGADFTEFQNEERLPDLLQMFQDVILQLYDCHKITVAVLNGFATGAGLDLALACDFRLASDRAKLSEAYITMGLVPDGGGSALLTALVGPGRAMHLFAGGEALFPEQALALGIVHSVHASAELDDRSLEFAKNLVAKPQTALRLIKKLIKQNSGVDLKQALNNEREAQLICFRDPAHQAIVREFLAKRMKQS